MFFTCLTEWTPGNLILRIVVSLILGSLIGIDRGAKKRGGGARTDAAVCLGATLVMMTAQYIEIVFPGKADMARLAAQVISGVGFLGAGSIIISGHQIKGLTSAASIWICACIGLAAGIGFVDGAVILTLILLSVLEAGRIAGLLHGGLRLPGGALLPCAARSRILLICRFCLMPLRNLLIILGSIGISVHTSPNSVVGRVLALNRLLFFHILHIGKQRRPEGEKLIRHVLNPLAAEAFSQHI